MSDFLSLESSDYYQQWLAEVAELDRHKWLLSERVGKDVGKAYAEWDWIMGGHRARWLEAYRHQHSGTH